MKLNFKKNIIISVLFICLFMMGIGYAALSQALNITGSLSSSGTWDIKKQVLS